MSTSDAFTVPCSQPSEYFLKLSLAWLLHSALSQVFAIVCVCLCTHTHSLSLTYFNPPSQLQLNPPVYVLFPRLDCSPYLRHTVPPLAHSTSSSFLQLLIFLWFFPILLTFLPLPFSPVSQPCMMIIPSSSLSPHLLLHTFL